MAVRKRLVDWLDIRLGVRDLLEQNLTRYLLPRNINIWYALGAVLLTLFIIQFVTGILLLVYYQPTAEEAFASVRRIMNEIPYGWLLRNLHAVGSNLIIVVLLLHMLSVLFMSSYKTPRELTWLSGFILFNLSLALCLTGYLLPWSQLSFWATTVATDAAGAVPFVGDALVRFLRGGGAVGDVTLGRFFALHVMGLPLVLMLLVGFHLFCVRRTGVSRPPFGPDYRPRESHLFFQHEEHRGGIPFFPHYFAKETAVIAVFLAILVTVTFFAPQVFIPAAALEPADPFVTPPGIKPEWYFLWAYQTLKIFPSELIGLAVQGGAMTFLALLPFIDRTRERRPFRRPVFLVLFVAGVAVFVGLSIWGHYS